MSYELPAYATVPRFWRTLAIGFVALFMMTSCTGQSPPSKHTAHASPTDLDTRFRGKPPSVKTLKRLCKNAIDSASESVVKKHVRISWTWPSKHVTTSVRCYNDFDSTISGPKNWEYGETEVIAWVEFRPHLDPKHEAALPEKKRQTSCDLLSGMSRVDKSETSTIAGKEVCTIRELDAPKSEYTMLSGYIDRATVVTMGTMGFVREKEDGPIHNAPLNSEPLAEDVHAALVEAVVKSFTTAD